MFPLGKIELHTSMNGPFDWPAISKTVWIQPVNYWTAAKHGTRSENSFERIQKKQGEVFFSIRSSKWSYKYDDHVLTKKVLLPECKKCTACHAATTRCAALSLWGGDLPWIAVPTLDGVPTLAGRGVPTLVRVVPTLTRGSYPGWGYLPWMVGTYLGQGVPTQPLSTGR